MTARVLTGSKQEIARALAGIPGDVREAIVFVDDPAVTSPAPAPAAGDGGTAADLFAEMEPYAVRASDFDDAREAIYSRGDGE